MTTNNNTRPTVGKTISALLSRQISVKEAIDSLEKLTAPTKEEEKSFFLGRISETNELLQFLTPIASTAGRSNGFRMVFTRDKQLATPFTARSLTSIFNSFPGDLTIVEASELDDFLFASEKRFFIGITAGAPCLVRKGSGRSRTSHRGTSWTRKVESAERFTEEDALKICALWKSNSPSVEFEILQESELKKFLDQTPTDEPDEAEYFVANKSSQDVAQQQAASIEPRDWAVGKYDPVLNQRVLMHAALEGKKQVYYDWTTSIADAMSFTRERAAQHVADLNKLGYEARPMMLSEAPDYLANRKREKPAVKCGIDPGVNGMTLVGIFAVPTEQNHKK